MVTTKRTDAQGLTIGELARRTGVTAPTLRMWETRHGFPEADRLSSGHRRYDESQVELVLSVLRRKEAGLSLAAAMAEVAGRTGPAAPSVFADLRRRHPQLAAYTMRKRTLTALTRAMEDECFARAQRPWLFGAFQSERFYRSSQSRWRDFAATARGAWVLAEFDDPDPSATPVEVALPHAAPMRREWSLVCLAEDLPVCLSAWELPGQSGVPDPERRFETVWTLDPSAVVDAARCLAATVSDQGHDLTQLRSALDGPGYLDIPERDLATGLFNRIVAYVDRSHP